MNKKLFDKWLRNFKKIEENASAERSAACLNIEKSYSDLDELYNSDRCANLLEQLTYTITDKNLGNSHKHIIPIDGEIYNDTQTLKAALALYIEFKENRFIEELKTTPDIDPDKHDGSYELIRETVKSLSTVPVEQLNFRDLELLYFMCIGTWTSRVDVKKNKVISSSLSAFEQSRLVDILDNVKNKAIQHNYENIEDKTKDHSIGMFGTGFKSFKRTTDKDVQRFLSLCVELKDMVDEEEMFNKVDRVISQGIKGMQSAAASAILHCLKPNVFPIMNGAVGDTETLFQLEGISLTKPTELQHYIQNARQLKKFRDEKCMFKNYRAMDKVISVYGRRIDMPQINFKKILDFLEQHAGFKYSKPENIIDQQEKNAMIFLKDAAQEAISEFKAIAEFFKKMGYTYEKTVSTWLDGSNQKIRNYFWLEIKKPQKDQLPSSISIFAEKEAGEVRFRITLEIKDDKSNDEYNRRHFRFLNMLNPSTSDFEYFGTYNKDLELNLEKNEDVEIFIKQVINREHHKLQIGRTISLEDVNSMSSDEILKKMLDTANELEPFYDKAVEDNDGGGALVEKSTFSNNLILFGPPGTGKTYNTVKYAVAIIENKDISKVEEEIKSNGYEKILLQYRDYKSNGQVVFTTFHQSYGYEEFIEGIKPVLDESSTGDIKYSIESGIFKEFCEKAESTKILTAGKEELFSDEKKIWKISLGGARNHPLKAECFKTGYIRIGWDSEDPLC